MLLYLASAYCFRHSSGLLSLYYDRKNVISCAFLLLPPPLPPPLFLSLLWIEPTALHILNKRYTDEAHTQLNISHL